MANLDTLRLVKKDIKRGAGAVVGKAISIKKKYDNAMIKARTTPSYKKAQKRMKSQGYW